MRTRGVDSTLRLYSLFARVQYVNDLYMRLTQTTGKVSTGGKQTVRS